MTIFLNKDSKVIVQGITGGEGSKHTARMLAAGTQVVGGVNARKAGTTVLHTDKDGNSVELPVFASVAEAIEQTGADVSIAFVPPAFTKDAVVEAIDAEIPLLVIITEGVPVQDSAEFWAYAKEQGDKTRIIGPNCPGIISPGESLVGITPANITGKGPIGLVSKSGTLTYQMMYELRDLGFSTAIGIGGDPIIGTTHIDALAAFEADPETKAIVMIGEIGGDAEERAADFIKANVTKPVVGYVAGFTAPEGKTMGHAGAIVSGSAGTAQAKKEALEAAGVKVGKTPSETAQLLREVYAALYASSDADDIARASVGDTDGALRIAVRHEKVRGMSESPDAGPATPADGEAVARDPVGAHHVRHRGVRLRRHPRLGHDRGRGRPRSELVAGVLAGHRHRPRVLGRPRLRRHRGPPRARARPRHRDPRGVPRVVPALAGPGRLGDDPVVHPAARRHEGHRRLRRALDGALGGRARARGARLDRLRAARVAHGRSASPARSAPPLSAS